MWRGRRVGIGVVGRAGAFVCATSALVLLATLEAAPASAGASGCTVRDSSTSQIYPSLQAAVNAAVAGDALEIAGTCAGETKVEKNLSLERASGAGGKPTLLGRVTTSGGVTLHFTQLKLTNGFDAAEGGAIYVSGCTSTGSINGGESAAGRELALYMVSSHVTEAAIGMAGSASITKSVISGNSGTGISVLGPLELVSSTVSKNAGVGIVTAWYGASLINSKVTGNKGGGIQAANANLYLLNSTVSGNTGAEQGGGISSGNSEVRLAGTSSVSKNSTAGTGGGIRASDWTDVTLEGSASVRQNTASADGGGIYVDENASVALDDEASVRNNVTTARGGGIYEGVASEEGGTKVTMGGSSLVTGNKAASAGGGVYLYGPGSLLELLGLSSIKSNQAGTNGGGIYAARTAYGAAILRYGAGWEGAVSGNRPDDVFTE